MTHTLTSFVRPMFCMSYIIDLVSLDFLASTIADLISLCCLISGIGYTWWPSAPARDLFPVYMTDTVRTTVPTR